ncbi:MAG TPA: M61 family peptidase, partial [Thermoanaerobaculia bacterium]|nr:M61 family peptidase [Thermoanaerobaculia bacterium]
MKKALLLILLAGSLHAQTIRVEVDATDAPRKVFHSRMTMPAAAGPMKLAFAKWLPGEHGPTGPIVDLVNVRVTANGQPVAWARDPRDMYLFNVNGPSGATELVVEASYLAPIASGQFTAGETATANLA